MPKVKIRAPKECVARDGIQKGARVEVTYTGPSSDPITTVSPSKKDVTLAEMAAAQGFSEDEVKRIERLKGQLDKGWYRGEDQFADVHFIMLCFEKILKKYAPQYTGDEIAEMHNF